MIIKTNPHMIQLLELDKNFKAGIIVMHNDVKENMLTMNEKIRNFNEEINHDKNQTNY